MTYLQEFSIHNPSLTQDKAQKAITVEIDYLGIKVGDSEALIVKTSDDIVSAKEGFISARLEMLNVKSKLEKEVNTNIKSRLKVKLSSLVADAKKYEETISSLESQLEQEKEKLVQLTDKRRMALSARMQLSVE